MHRYRWRHCGHGTIRSSSSRWARYDARVLPLPPGGFLHLAALACAAALLGGLASIERKGAFQLMLSRPLVLAPLFGLLLGDLAGGLFIGVPLELLFLGGVNLGGSVPENETLLCAALGLVLLAPLALLGRWLDRQGEIRAVALSARARVAVAMGEADPARIQLRGLLWPFLTTAAICAALVLAAPLLAALRMHVHGRLEFDLGGSWHAAQALSIAAAIRAIRDRRAIPLAGATALAVFAAALLVRMHG